MIRKTPAEYVVMSKQLIEDVVNDKCHPLFISANIKAAGSFEKFMLSLLADENYFKDKIKE